MKRILSSQPKPVVPLGGKKMYHQQLLLPLGLLALIGVLAVGCGSLDCEWSTTVKTWVDTNENGAWDNNELPLADVKCFIEGSYAVGLGEAVSNQDGKASLSIMLAGCPEEAVFSIYVEPPSGYLLTTQARLLAHKRDEGPFLFGFAPTMNPD